MLRGRRRMIGWKECQELEVERKRPKRTWRAVEYDDMRKNTLPTEVAMEQAIWRWRICGRSLANKGNPLKTVVKPSCVYEILDFSRWDCLLFVLYAFFFSWATVLYFQFVLYFLALRLETLMAVRLFICLFNNTLLFLFSADKLFLFTSDNVEWKLEEIESFHSAILKYDKDFFQISRHVRLICLFLWKYTHQSVLRPFPMSE
jgi:hypothetical protein